MSGMASQITGVSIVCPTVGSGADQRIHQSSASLAFVRGILRWPMNSPHRRPVTRKMYPFDDVIMWSGPSVSIFPCSHCPGPCNTWTYLVNRIFGCCFNIWWEVPSSDLAKSRTSEIRCQMFASLWELTGASTAISSKWYWIGGGGDSTQRTSNVIITPLLRQNDVATSFWRDNDVIIAPVRWKDEPLTPRVVIMWTLSYLVATEVVVKTTYRQRWRHGVS